MKKALVATSTFPRWAGDSTPGFVYELSRRLASKFSISVLAPHCPGAKKKEETCGMRIYRFQYFFPSSLQRLCYNGGIMPNLQKSILAKIQVPFFVAAEFLSMGNILRKEKAKIVHAHWIIPQGFVAAALKKLLPFKLVTTVHAGDVFPLKSSFLRWFGRFALENSDYCTVNSRFTKNSVLGITQKIKKIEIVPMGVDLKQFCSSKRSRQLRRKLGHNCQIILAVGRLAEKKGFIHLINAMPEVLHKFPCAKLVIAGSGPERPILEQSIKRLNLRTNVILAGEIPNSGLPAYYASSDIFVLPSVVAKSGDTEGLGVVLLEAIASGTPVIGSDVGGIPDIINHGETGLLVSQKSEKSLADAIIRLLSDEKLRKTLSANALRLVRDRYSWDKVSAKFTKIYLQVGGSHGINNP